MNQSMTSVLSISAVERETGLSKDVLRKWETRYGFPSPLRDSLGERAYPLSQVDRLRLIKRLMDTGMRPSRLIRESDENLNALALVSQTPQVVIEHDDVEMLTLEKLRNQDPSGLRKMLYRELMRQGVQRFVQDTLTPLNYAIGEAWACGELGIHEEHAYSEVAQGLLRETIAKLADNQGRPRVLMTTLPDEQHGLGLLMLAAVLSLHGAYCISLGTQTPVQDIVEAATAHHADVVALSFSNAYPQRRILPALEELRQRLDGEVEVWAGGTGCARLHTPSDNNIHLLADIDQTLTALSSWQSARQAA
jgi:methylmalonyl-CoA mutase cobalamin-binding subunit/DNA-binding transcriptional MerR regulator